MPANQLLSNPQLCFVGTAPSTGRPGWSNKGYTRGRHARALVKALADSLSGFWPRCCPLSAGLSLEHLVGLCTEHLVGFWSACPPSVCPAPECLSGLCFEILDRGRTFQLPVGGTPGQTQGRRPENRYKTVSFQVLK